MLGDWKTTKIWNALTASAHPEAELVKATLQLKMPGIETVLKQGGTSPTDFTLHDADHSFRVAERMAEIVPGEVLSQLSVYELPLLLLSAYLHDIGMTPEQRKVTLHYDFLLSGNRGELSIDEVNAFQRWLDDQDRELAPPLASGTPTSDTLHTGAELIAHYCRHRHNDWSEEFIRNTLGGVDLGTYSGWLDDLILLCRSHHYGYHDLIRPDFNPRPVGAAKIVHLRYLACVLRIADILDFDPERTPDVIFRHRQIRPESFIFWWKDKEISVVKEQSRYAIYARPQQARVQRALEITVDGIDRELALCRRLADETHFESCPGLHTPLPHAWELQAPVHRDIAPKQAAYEYIDGAFRPNTQRVLELLSGIELYRDPLAATRELLQNAFDAIREQIAYERLSQPSPNRPGLELELGKLHRVELRLESSANSHWLICRDSGVGMTKAIIRDHLLVAGAARRHDILALERRCNEAGFQLGRTGEFGIGVLAYFMLADNVIIKTRRSQDAGDAETSGWTFETEGIDSFGELRPDKSQHGGTEIRLRLRKGIVPDPSAFYSRVSGYVSNLLVQIPCEFALTSPIPGCVALTYGPGWVEFTKGDLIKNVVRRRATTHENFELLSTSRKREIDAEKKDWEQLAREMAKAVRWISTEGELPSNLGSYRIHIPYFDLPGGASLLFMRVRQRGKRFAVQKISGAEIMPLSLPPRTAWKGMRTHLHWDWGRRRTGDHAMVEVDLRSKDGGRLAIDRHAVSLTNKAEVAFAHLSKEIDAIRTRITLQHHSSIYAAINSRLTGSSMPRRAPVYWIPYSEDIARAAWLPVKFPAAADV